MKADTIAILTRPYQEIVDDVLTAMTGGITNEPIIFDLRADQYPLARPASDIRSITGTAGGARSLPDVHLFCRTWRAGVC